MKYLIFPLGNSGDKYKETRHNAGRYVFDLVKQNKDLDSLFENKELEEFIPECFMNESGEYLKKYLKNKNFETKNIILIYDDKDLELGRIKLSFDRGSGGHNGVKNVIENIKSKEFWRIRIGIAPVNTEKDNSNLLHGDIVREYVLAKITKQEKDIFTNNDFLKKISDYIKEIVAGKEIK